VVSDCFKDSFFLDIKSIAILKDKRAISQSTWNCGLWESQTTPISKLREQRDVQFQITSS
jgi:hypothetical protein